MKILTKSQCEKLRDIGFVVEGTNITLQDIIDKLPESIEEREFGRFDYEFTLTKHEVIYKSYDVFDKNGEPYILHWFAIGDENCNSLLDCAFEMLVYLKTEKYI